MDILAPVPLWLLFGLFLWVLELFTPALVAGSMGTAALLTAAFAGWVPSSAIQFFLFAVLSGVFVVSSRRLVPKASRKLDNPYYQAQAVVTTDILPGSTGRIALQGSTWNAICDLPDSRLRAGQKVMVVGREGTVLRVVPLNLSDPLDSDPLKP
jgi:membrane protein implicated in regulation of membrane protease activity